MIIYLLIFLVPLLFSTFSGKFDNHARIIFWRFFSLFLILIIGLRHEIGYDWVAYINMYHSAKNEKILDIISETDPAYAFINWLSALFSGQVYTVNLICSVLFVNGLVSFCQKQQSPGIAFAVAFPIMVLIAGMSYTRQSVAVGFEFLALLALISGNNKKFIFFIILASAFHLTAIFLLSLVGFVAVRKKLFVTVGLVFVAATIKFSLQFQTAHVQVDLYFDQKLDSGGGIYRIALNIIPAILVIWFLNKSKLPLKQFNLWQTFSIMSLGCIPLIAFIPAATDRLSIYLIPIQMFVYSNLRLWFAKKSWIFFAEFGVVLLYFALLLVWLLFSSYGSGWIPYKNLYF